MRSWLRSRNGLSRTQQGGMKRHRSFRLVMLLSLPISYLVAAFLPPTGPALLNQAIQRRHTSRLQTALSSIAKPPPTAQSTFVRGSWIVEERGYAAIPLTNHSSSSSSSIYNAGASAYLLSEEGQGVNKRAPTSVMGVLEAELGRVSAYLLEERFPCLLMKDPKKIRHRLDRLKEALPGCNVTAIIMGAPILAWGQHTAHQQELANDDDDDDALVASARHTFVRLQEYIPAAYAAELVTRMPRLLLRDFSTRIEPYFHFMKVAFPTCDLGYMVHKNPFLLVRSITSCLQPRLDLLHELFPGISPENVTSLVGGNQDIWRLPASALRERVAELEEVVPADTILPILTRHPRTWTADLTEVVRPQTTVLRSRLREGTVQQVIRKLPSALYYSPALLQSKLTLINELFGGAEDAEAVLGLNPMILAMEIRATVRPKFDYLRTLFLETTTSSTYEEFMSSIKTELGARLLTAGFGRLGRLGYVLQVNPFLSIKQVTEVVSCSSEDIRRKYPGYENFLEDKIECRFPKYTWEQICAVPFSLREKVHGEILHRRYAEEEEVEQEEEAPQQQPPRSQVEVVEQAAAAAAVEVTPSVLFA